MMKVLVTGATRNAGLAIARGLAGQGCEVIGADERRLPFNAHTRYTKPYYQYPTGYQDGFLYGLMEIIQKEKPDLLIPVSGTKHISMHKELIEKFTKVMLPDYRSYMAAFDNQTTLEECKELGIGRPDIWREKEVQLVLKQNRTSPKPLSFVLKPRADMGGARGLGIFNDEKSFKSLQKKTMHYGPYCIQEYIPGGPENMRTMNLLFDENGKVVAHFATKKIRQWPNTGGISVLSESIHAPDLVDFVMPFFEKWHWQGMAEVEIKIDARDQKPKLIEINPRFCGYIGFAIACGVNFPWDICRLTEGKKVEKVSYPAGVEYINWPAYLKAAFSEVKVSKNKAAAIIKIRNELKGRKKTNNMAWADWKTVVAKMIFELSNKEGASDVWNLRVCI
jgi:D-aspartate ligase